MTESLYKSPESEVIDQSQPMTSLTIGQILFSFKGRIGRKQYWLSYLGMIAVLFTVGIVAGAMGIDEDQLNIFFLILYVPIFWISFAISAKRFHDRNKSGWWVLIGFIPIIGSIWLLIENGCLAGDMEANDFGAPHQ